MRLLVRASFAAALSCSARSESAEVAARAAPARAVASVPAPVAPAPAPAPHTRIDGRDFPDKVLALTWDDGPDAGTLALATYLASHRIAATFFVVHSWVEGLSDDPGEGRHVFETGYQALPVLGELVALGHRLGNHTLHHVLLREARGRALLLEELRENQRNLDPFLGNELRLFRAPGGGWGAFAADLVDTDPYLARMAGPFAWDVDQKDWDESLRCLGARGASECERLGPSAALRTKPSVVAARYAAAIERAGRGIVLLHDRVGHVGSTYSLELARALVPRLEARGFVFAAPVLRFSPPQVRSTDLRFEPSTLRFGDVDGDRRHDLCGRSAAGVRCAVSVQGPTGPDDRLPRTTFRALPSGDAPESPQGGAPAGPLHVADVTGDGRADVCVAAAAGIACAASSVTGELGAFRGWTSEEPLRATLRLADVDGDGKADACARTAAGVMCARSLGDRFEAARTWLGDQEGIPEVVQLADVDGDGRADVCGDGASGLACALSSGKAFGRLTRRSGDLPAQTRGPLVFGDLNGDRRADVCTIASQGVLCALGAAGGLTRASVWLSPEHVAAQGWQRPERAATLQLADVNGDGRADLCGVTDEGIACALAP